MSAFNMPPGVAPWDIPGNDIDIVDRLRRRVLKAHGGTADPAKHHWNLTEGDSVMHRQAAEEIEVLRNAVNKACGDNEEMAREIIESQRLS